MFHISLLNISEGFTSITSQSKIVRNKLNFILALNIRNAHV